MITSEFIIKYTNALYSTPKEYSPSYDEFRDMFSNGQIKSKEWLINQLINLNLDNKTYLIAGAWFGTLGLLIKKQFPLANVTMLDIDPRCKTFIDNIIYNEDDLNCITHDMYTYSYNEDIIINTSCEHINNVDKWISIIPKNKTVILQSNNYKKGTGHINCVESEDELIEKSRLVNVLYKGKLEMPEYSRFMVIGKT